MDQFLENRDAVAARFEAQLGRRCSPGEKAVAHLGCAVTAHCLGVPGASDVVDAVGHEIELALDVLDTARKYAAEIENATDAIDRLGVLVGILSGGAPRAK